MPGRSGQADKTLFFGTDADCRQADSPALLVDAETGRVVEANPQSLALLKCSAAEIAGKRFPDLLDRSRVEDAGGAICYRFESEDGISAFYDLSSISLEIEGRQVKLYLFHDVTGWAELQTDLTNRNLELSHLARHDHLTDLFNRYMFRDTLALANARLGRADGLLGVLYIDLDDFKQVNDRYGHDAGDRVLREVAGRLRGAVRTSDVAARLGGDEFAVILENLHSPEDALKVANHIIGVLSEPYSFGRETVRISASIGAVVTGKPLDDVTDLVTRADAMMFEAKSRGRGQASLDKAFAPPRKAARFTR
jgi:diguanylate cyclase (GGDEF)-like protein